MPTAIGQPGLWVAVGRSGAGKTYGIRQQLYRAARVHPIIVVDTQGEWETVPRALARVTAIVPTVAQAAKRIREGVRLAVVQGNLGAAEEACSWAHADPAKTGGFTGHRRDRSVRGVAIAEAHLVAPQGSLDRLSPALVACVTAWRHGRVALWLDTQRFALLNRTAIAQSVETRLYAIDVRDVPDVAKDYRSPQLIETLREAGRRMKAGKPGWHVRLDVAPEPPFVLVRE